MSGPALTLAIVTRDRPELLAGLLLPSVAAADVTDVEVLVVDQSAGGETRALVEAHDGLRYVWGDPPLSRGRNAAVEAARAPLIAFTDDDVEFAPDWPQRVLAAFERHPEAGAICGGGVDSRGRTIPRAAAGVYRHPATPWGLGHGFNFAFRRAALQDAGPFDELLGAGSRFRAGEDSDMLWRVMRSGWPVVCDDGIGVRHHDWRQGLAVRSLQHGYGLGAGAQVGLGLRRGDLALLRVAALFAARGLYWLGGALRRREREATIRHALWLGGFGSGFAHALVMRSHGRR